jgi:putative FmdB family regulatory protein
MGGGRAVPSGCPLALARPKSAPPSTLRQVPIYEYVCMKCERQFEELVHADEIPACPSCAAKTVTRKFSSFATVGGPVKSCSTCTSSSCGECGGR